MLNPSPSASAERPCPRPLAFRVINDARILAFKRSGPRPNNFCGGLVLSDSEEDRPLRHVRGSTPVDSFDPSAKIEAKLSGRYAYGGVTNRHFGHFMSEMVHRILPLRQYDPNLDFVFVSSPGNPQNSFVTLPPYVQQVYSFFGLEAAQVQVITRNTLVECLYVSEAGSTLGAGPKEAYLDMLDGYTEPKLNAMFGSAGSRKRIYVSRTRLTRAWGGGLCGEGYLESALAAEGYEIFHPQKHPIAVQMDHYRKADVVIFAGGSACHGTELLGRNAIKSCILLPRMPINTQLDRVLNPRARQYFKAPQSVHLGTTYTKPDGRDYLSKGMAVFRWDAMVRFLRNVGAARLRSTSKEAYMAAAAEDLSRYIDQTTLGREPTTYQHLLSKLVHRFEAVSQNMRGPSRS